VIVNSKINIKGQFTPKSKTRSKYRPVTAAQSNDIVLDSLQRWNQRFFVQLIQNIDSQSESSSRAFKAARTHKQSAYINIGKSSVTS